VDYRKLSSNRVCVIYVVLLPSFRLQQPGFRETLYSSLVLLEHMVSLGEFSDSTE
jgi:hypothetical protein